MNSFTLIIPVFNEKENLLLLKPLLIEFIDTTDSLWKVLFVNDGSTDGSKEIINQLCKSNSNFHSLHFDVNRGLSTALKAGFDKVQTTWIAYMDSDLQVLPIDFSKLLPYIEEYDLISGKRKNRKDDFLKIFSSFIANSFRRIITRDGMKDSGCPLKLIRTKFLTDIPFFDGIHRFLPALVQLQGGKTIEIPIRHFPRKTGKSNFGTWNRLWQGIHGCFIFLKIKKTTKFSMKKN